VAGDGKEQGDSDSGEKWGVSMRGCGHGGSKMVEEAVCFSNIQMASKLCNQI
jgi:hypothetical protein